MFPSHLLFIVPTLVAMAAAQPQCDPITQYEKDGRCCLKCDPGTRMSSQNSCVDPQCKECGENEYQEKYTTATSCERQEYCDPNKRFKWRVHQDKKKRIPCVCEDGFHCSGEMCLTCVPHRNCPPGFGARSIGNHTHDTVCEKCPEGHFSKSNTWNSVCQKWTVCEGYFHVLKEGTGESDVECEESRKSHIVVPVVFLALVLLGAVVAGVLCLRRKSKQGFFNVNPKNLLEAHLEEIKELKNRKDVENEEPRKPEENEHDQSLDGVTGVTANGKVLSQENGKTDDVFPRQESRIDTTESFCF
ncbi:unnamed protein product [Ophioblennius macclurei]